MKYFYAPINYTDETDTFYPGMTSGGDTVDATLPPLCSSPLCDKGAENRFVVVVPDDSFAGLDGWTQRTKAEINSDYPGLIP